jgi:nicotinamide mononucleotide (NMN) deamidase PncC
MTARADSPEEAAALIVPLETEMRNRLPGLIMGADDDTLEGVVDALLTARGWTIAVAETATGGIVAQRLTAAGARSFAGGWVFPPGGQPGGGAVEMADAVLVHYAADCGLAIALDADGQQTQVRYVTPEGTVEWTLGYAQTDGRSQMRTGVVALERVRRFLTGVSPLDP